jgi:hypothetical protein
VQSRLDGFLLTLISRTPPSSRIPRTVLVIGIVCLLASFAGVILVAAHKNDNDLPPAASAQVPATSLDGPAKTRIAKHFGRLLLSFEINKGQIDESVKFLSHGAGYDLFLTSTEAVLRVQKPRASQVDKLKDPALANTVPDANVREGSVLRPNSLRWCLGCRITWRRAPGQWLSGPTHG